MFHYEISITTGRHLWTYKCSTVTEAFNALVEAAGSLDLPITPGATDEYMEALVDLLKATKPMQVVFMYFLLRKAEGEV